MSHRSGRLVAGLVAGHLFIASAGASPADGKRDFTPFVSTADEKKIGASEHPKVLAQYGGAYPDDNVAGYVAQIGGRMALNSELASERFTYTLLNSKVLNAFALPGGYVYITRQLLALMNDEAELASVLGHETGHITDRHTAKRETTNQWSTGLATVLGIFTGSNIVTNLLASAGQLYTLSYSRNQEYKADQLGIRYITRAGYDPFAAGDMLHSLDIETNLSANLHGQKTSRSTFTSTHPLTADRVAKAYDTARATKLPPGKLPRNRSQFLHMIDGLVVDDSADQGLVNGHSFAHPKLGMGFTVPEGFVLENGDQAVTANGPNGVAVQFAGNPWGAEMPLDGYINRLWSQLTGQNEGGLGPAQASTINGFEVASAGARAQTRQGSLDVTIVAYRYSPGSVYHFVLIVPSQLGAQYDEGLKRMLSSFHRLSRDEIMQFHERRVKIVTVGKGDTAQSLSARMAYEDHQLERFLVLNSLSANDPLPVGQEVKLVVYGRQ